jgi:hypothetical protein
MRQDWSNWFVACSGLPKGTKMPPWTLGTVDSLTPGGCQPGMGTADAGAPCTPESRIGLLCAANPKASGVLDAG